MENFNYTPIFTNSEKYYSVGTDGNEDYVMEIVITWVAWYSRYFRISKQEFNWHKNDLRKLDTLADRFYSYKNPKDCEQFIYSQKTKEN